jgi:NitT/TauT family transport system permease protein
MKPWLLPFGLALTWEILARSPLGDPLYSPSLLQIGAAFATLVTSGELVTHLRASALRWVGGFTLALVSAVPFGLVLGYSAPLKRHLMPMFDLLRSFPSITLVPVAIVWFGIGDLAKAFLVAYACFWPMLLNTMTGVQETSPVLLRAARVMAIDGFALFHKVIVPSAIPSILTGVRISLAVSVIVLIVSEMVAATSGIGFLILDAERNYLTGKMFAGVLIMGGIGATLNALAQRTERYLLEYRKPA